MNNPTNVKAVFRCSPQWVLGTYIHVSRVFNRTTVFYCVALSWTHRRLLIFNLLWHILTFKTIPIGTYIICNEPKENETALSKFSFLFMFKVLVLIQAFRQGVVSAFEKITFQDTFKKTKQHLNHSKTGTDLKTTAFLKIFA